MTALNLFTMISNVSNILRELESEGLRLEIGGDFASYRRLRNKQTDRNAIFPMFDVSSSYVDASNAFWVCGFDENQELVHTQAMRLLELKDVPLSQHLREHRHKYITPGTTPDPDRTFYSDIPVLDRISGRVCYHGEFWIKGGKGGHRSQGFSALLSRVVFELSLKLWSPDYTFGFVAMPLAMKGMPVRYGYSHCEYGVWYGPEQEVTSEETIVWMSNQDMQQFLETKPRSLSDERSLPARGDLSMSMVA
ncbi:MAG: hypothetical protein QNJ20_07980 [Paracoccaceae bacterium]|nr:hypothetical protein [Paracoccaceae bacterium]